MRTEVRQLETLKVGKNMTESEARKLASEERGEDFNFTLGEHTKDTHSCTLPLSCEGFRLWSGSAFRSGIYAPTSSLDSLRCVLALASLWDLWLITSDVSYCFHVC